jgi:hypothetical protein
MRNLEQALRDHELITIRVIGEWWELDLTGMEKNEAVDVLAGALTRLDMQQEMAYLPPEEAAALQDLISQGGRAAVAAFNRLYGEVRLMGPGRMEREEPWLDPASPLEALWYRGFLFRAFDDTAEGVLEFYYLPQELLEQFPSIVTEDEQETPALLEPIEAPAGTTSRGLVNSVDDLTTLIAAALQPPGARNEQANEDDFLLDQNPDRKSLLLNLAVEQGWLREDESSLKPTRAAVDWLKEGREAQLFELADAWSKSSWNELCHTPGLTCDGHNWQNDPILARTAVLDVLPLTDSWYSLKSLVDLIRDTNPDFQRPDGNYDTWYVRDNQTNNYLSGFDSWDLVEGRLIPFLITAPMYWLGITLVSGSAEDVLFRLSDQGLRWLGGEQPQEQEEKIPIVVHPDASILVAHNADRYLRFQVARVAELEIVDGRKPYAYRLTPDSLAAAGDQEISVDRLLRFLSQASGSSLPKSLLRAVERWSERGVEGRLESVIVLRVSDAEILQTLRNNPKTRDFLGESLGDLAVAIKPGQWRQLRAACAQLGLFIDDFF